MPRTSRGTSLTWGNHENRAALPDAAHAVDVGAGEADVGHRAAPDGAGEAGEAEGEAGDHGVLPSIGLLLPLPRQSAARNL